MMDWFNALPALERIFFYIALPATLVLLVQTVMLFIGGLAGEADGMGLDSDTSGLDIHTGVSSADTDFDTPDFSDASGSDIVIDLHGLRFLTMRGIIAFLTVLGWSGVCFMELKIPGLFAAILAFIAGFLALIAIAYLVRALLRLQESGNADYYSAIGHTGSVYIPIPANKAGTGKINLELSGRFSEIDAVTEGDESLKTGESVRVIDVINGSVMVVEAEIKKPVIKLTL